MELETIQTDEELFGLREEWNTLLKSSASDCLFLTHEWLSVWWKHLAEGRRLHIVTARDRKRLVGIFPIAERPPQLARMMPRAFEFLGGGVIESDYLDVVVQQGYEHEVMPAIAEHLHARRMMVQLSQLRRGACAAA